MLRRYFNVLFLRRHLPAFVVFNLMAYAFMGRSLSSCSDTVIGGVGDHLSGIVWLLSNTDAPYGGATTMSNFPFGESLFQPQLITSAVPMVLVWLIAKVVGPICAWNIMVYLAYMSCALIMYAFVLWLTRKRYLALFGALAVTFTPFHYYKSAGHLSYLLSAVLIAILWSILYFWQKPNIKSAALLASTIALAFYSDGYFPLIAGVMCVVVFAYLLFPDIKNFFTKSTVKTETLKKLRLLCIALLMIMALLLPIFTVRVKYGASINKSLDSARSDPVAELLTYGARLPDYVLPAETHPITPIREIAQDFRAKYDYSNISERNLYLGTVVIALALFAIYTATRAKTQRLNIFNKSSVLLFATGALGAWLVSLSPRAFGGNTEVITVSRVIVEFLTYWRVFARFYLVVSIFAVLLAVFGLYQLVQRIKEPRRKHILICVIILISVIDLMPINPFSRTDEFSQDETYPTYRLLKDDSSVTAVAAYPLVDSPFNATYFGDQITHDKPLLNSQKPDDRIIQLHDAITGLSNSQTLGVLSGLGISHVLVYSTEVYNPGLSLKYGDFPASVYEISDNVVARDHALIGSSGLVSPVVEAGTGISCQAMASALATLTPITLNQGTPPRAVKARFNVAGTVGDKFTVTHGDTILTRTIESSSGSTVELDVTTNTAISIMQPNALVKLPTLKLCDMEAI